MKFNLHKIEIPNSPIIILITKAFPVDIRPAGKGRFAVLTINLSISTSIILFNALADAVTKNPHRVR